MIENKRMWVGVGIMIAIGIAIYLLPKEVPKKQSLETSIVVLDTVQTPPPEPKRLYGIIIDSMQVIEGKIKRNQNLSEILDDYNISNQKIYELSIASKPVFDVRKMVAYKKYTVISYPDSLNTAKALIYEPNLTEYVVFNLGDSVTVEHITKEILIKEREVAGIIMASLAVTIDELDISPQLTNDFVDVLAWQVDFGRLQKGDRFKVIYEEELVDDQPVGIGKIKGIYFEHFNNGFYAFYFNQGSGIDYFDEEGNSLRKALLKYPLEFTRISSRYSGNRYHPVQKRWKAHRGTDFAAKKGTPIRSVGDGIVTEATYGKYNGRYVKIRHNATYSTQYLHMNSIASSIKPGQKVKRGQTIGYVGSTGLAKGNHLCYRFWKNGVQVNALNVDLPPSEPIAESHYIDFEAARDTMTMRLDKIPFPEEKSVLQAGI